MNCVAGAPTMRQARKGLFPEHVLEARTRNCSHSKAEIVRMRCALLRSGVVVYVVVLTDSQPRSDAISPVSM